MKELKEMSARELKALAKKANELAKELEAEQPGYSIAIECGVLDNSYDTTANGRVYSYSGSAIIKMENGTVWKAIGHRSSGDAWYANDGYIEFFKMETKT